MRDEPLREISINDLPKYTPWVARCLHLDPFPKPVRDLAKINAEYDKDKYAKLLAYFKKHPNTNFDDLRNILLQTEPNITVCISREGKLFLTSSATTLRLCDEALVEALAEPLKSTRVVVELGCGYGPNFPILMNAFPDKLWVGGDYSSNAIELAAQLFTNCKNVSVVPFNWYDKTWTLVENLSEKAVVFTRQSIEQLPRVSEILPTFHKYKDKISEVIHLEPIFELADECTTLGLIRRAYTLLNDYNTDLLTTLNDMGVHILKQKADLIGYNPLNPISLIHWRFK